MNGAHPKTIGNHYIQTNTSIHVPTYVHLYMCMQLYIYYTFLLSLIDEAECILIGQPILVFGCHWQHNRNALIGHTFVQ